MTIEMEIAQTNYIAVHQSKLIKDGYLPVHNGNTIKSLSYH